MDVEITYGSDKVKLSIPENNLAGMRLYRRLGFREEGRRIGAVRVDDEFLDLIEMVKELGYAGIVCTAGKGLGEMIREVDNNGLILYSVYLGANIDSDQPKYGPELKETIEVLKGRNAILWLFVRSKKLKPSSLDGDERAEEVIREIADMAAKGCGGFFVGIGARGLV